MREGGFDFASPTLFVWEFVAPYLPPEAVLDVLQTVRARCAAGSSIIFDYVLADLMESDTIGAREFVRQLLSPTLSFVLPEAIQHSALTSKGSEVASKGSADTMCRTPSLAIGSATEQTMY